MVPGDVCVHALTRIQSPTLAAKLVDQDAASDKTTYSSRGSGWDSGSSNTSSQREVVSKQEAQQIAVGFGKGFDGAAYDRMGQDVQRVSQYRKAIAKAVPGRTVIDIGTGRDALLAQMCAREGAAHVAAVEVVPKAAADARQTVQMAGLAGRIRVVEGHSGTVPLPKADLLVHEIVGSMALEEGMARAMLDLQKRPEVVDSSRPGWSLPRYVETRVAPVMLAGVPPATVASRTTMDLAPGGHGHWVRLAVDRLQNVPSPVPGTLLGELQRLESLNVEAPIEPQLYQLRDLTWRVRQPAILAGFACAPWLDLDGEHSVDAWLGGTSWPHKLIGLESPVVVATGDELHLHCYADLRSFPVRYGFTVMWRRPAPLSFACAPKRV